MHFLKSRLSICVIIATVFSSALLFGTRSNFPEYIFDDMSTKEKIEHLKLEIQKYDRKKPDKVIDLSEKLLHLAYATGDKELEFTALTHTGVAYIDKKKYDKSIEYLQKANTIANNTQIIADSLKSKLYNNIGGNYFFKEEYDSATVYYEKSLELRKGKRDTKEYLSIISNLAYLYQTLEKYEKALTYYFDLLRVYDDQKAINKQTDILRRIGRIYFYLRKYEDAVKYTKQAADLIRNQKDTKNLGKVLTTIGNIYYESNNYNEALKYYGEALEYVKDTKSTKGKAVLLNNIGLIQIHFGKYRDAFHHIEQSIIIRNQIDDKSEDLFHPYTSLAELSMKQGQFFNSIKYLDSALRIAKHNKNFYEMKATYELLYKSHKNLDKHEKALEYHELYTAMADSTASSELSSKIENLKIQYETEKKETENALLRRQNSIQKLYFMMISGLIFIMLLLVFTRYRSKQDANKKLNIKNEQIHKQHEDLKYTFEQLRKSEEQLREANATKDKFFSIIAHDLKNPIHAITLSSDLLINKFKFMDSEQLIEVVQNINKSGNHLSVLLTNLLQWARAKTSSIDFQPEVIDLYNAVKETFGLLEFNAKKKEISLLNNVPEKTYIYADPNMIDSILRNLISNAIKFTPTHGFVSIGITIEDSSIFIKIKDNGIGISKEDKQKLFRLDVHHTTKGTYNEKGTGLGLLLCKEFITRHEGTLAVESSPGKGSTFIVQFPLNHMNVIENRAKITAKKQF